jgi:lysine-specific metallo-endopeptidase family protein
MPTLNAQVIYQGLTIKYHTTKPVTTVQQMKLFASYELAKKILDKVVSEIQSIKSAMISGSKSGANAMTRNILVHHFHLDEPHDKASKEQWTKDLNHILSFYQATKTGLSGPTTISDAYSDVVKGASATADRGYVGKRHDHSQPLLPSGHFPIFTGDLKGGTKYSPGRLGSVHIDFDLLNTDSKLSIARTIIHESTHKYKDTEDHAYAWYHQTTVAGTAYNELTKAEAMDNADSYAYAAICIYKKQLLTGPINTLS